MCNAYGYFLVVFMYYGWAFFPDCCLWCFVISLCFWYVKLVIFHYGWAFLLDYCVCCFMISLGF
ncbi:hypothetical protein BC941DRAFT_407955 [Chlamydoabsidia padenii]|nr:hypothetical protein BC941DRAFT_407955 [Chlamydoabsidia padenii]